MNFRTDPVVAETVRHLDMLATHEAELERAERGAMEDFTAACRQADANALCQWADLTTDWDKVKPPVIAGQHLPTRRQTLAEVMEEVLDYSDGPGKTELMQLVLNVAYGSDTVNAPAQARALLKQMAVSFARRKKVMA